MTDRPDPAAALIDQLRDAFMGPGDQLTERIFDRPALLWPERWPELEAFADRQHRDFRETILSALGILRDMSSQLAGQDGWYRGGGPVEKLAARIDQGLITEEEAKSAVVQPELCLRLSPDYVFRMAERAAGRSANGAWQQAVPFARLLVAAAEAYPPGAAREAMRRHAVLGWLSTATRACSAVPDGLLFSDAKARGLELLAAMEGLGERRTMAETLFRLGVLHLDPYQSGRDLSNLEAELNRWRQRFVDLYGELMLQSEDRMMPDAAAAVREASDYLARAAELGDDFQRGLALKARADALLFLEFAGEPADRDSLRECVEEALKLLPEDQFPSAVARLHSLTGHLEMSSAEPPGADETDIERADPTELIARNGYLGTIEQYKATLTGWSQTAPGRARRLAIRLWPELHDPEKDEVAQILFRAILAEEDVEALLERHGDDYQAAAAEIGGWEPQRRLIGLAALAINSTGASREGEALAAADEAARLSRDILPEMNDALDRLCAWVLTGAAVNGARAGRWEGVTRTYCAALEIFTRIGAIGPASDLLKPIADAAAHEGRDGAVAMSLALASLGPLLDHPDRPRMRDQVHQMWIELLASSLAAGSFEPALFNLQIQAAKGAAFAAMLHSGTLYEAGRDAEAMALLERRSAVGASEGLSNLMLNEYVLIAHYVEPAAHSGPVGAVERLAQRFDAHVTTRMVGGEVDFQAYLAADEWAQLLDPSDILVNQYLGSDEQGGLAIITPVRSVDGLKITAGKSRLPEEGGLPIKYVELTVEQRKLEVNAFGLTVSSLREALQDHPGPAQATDEALEGLRAVAGNFRGAFAILEEEEAGGRTHLCLVPHGPYHFCPIHLAPYGDGLLADDWTVTYLPHPALLRRRRAPLDDAKAGAAAFGIGFVHGEHGLEPLPGAADEARTVAELIGGTAWLDLDATEARLTEALATCRFVHIATHGEQNVFAPMLQRLFLAPAEGSDGIFHAYEALGLDLRHLDLVTLSACETALGRFDVNDNLRGLSATLFIAGARTVVSTLWPVHDSVARRFFETLYGRIAAGDGKLTAFRSAQVATRKNFPAYRDWGAFVYAGCW